MQVVLINSPIYNKSESEIADNDYLPPFGLGYLATRIQDKNWDVIIIDAYQQGLSVASVLQRLNDVKPDIIGINIFSVNIPIVKEILESYSPKAKLIIGGQCAQFIWEEIVSWNIENEMIVIAGESDLIICDAIEGTVLQNPVFEKAGRKVYHVDSASKYYPDEINLLPLNRALFNDYSVLNHYGQKESAIITSRGCIYNCAFCGAAKSHNLMNKVRIKDKQLVITEINDLIKEDPKVECIRVLDDLFLKSQYSIKDAIEIFNHFNVSWRAMAHIKSFDNVSEELIIEMKNSGCVELFIGIESGSDKIRKMINKTGTVEEVENVTKKILKCGINIKGYFIFGFPLESETDMELSYKVAEKIYRNSLDLNGKFRTSVFQYRPYHGTTLYNQFVVLDMKQDYHENKTLSELINRSNFNISTINYSECDDKILYDFISRTNKLGGQYD